MKTLTFVVREPRREDVVIDVQADRVLLGSGAHCDIRLPLEAAAWEQVVVTVENEIVMARVLATDGTTLFDGEAKREAELLPGAVMRIDTVSVTLRSCAGEAVKVEAKSPLRTAGLFVGLMVMAAALLVLKSAAATETAAAPVAPDPISHAEIECPEKQGALPLAHQKLALARSMRERFRFYPREGVAAVILYRTAAACFEAASDVVHADQTLAEAAAVQVEVRDELHVSRVRLERALVRKDARTALAQVKLQRDLLAGTPQADAYVTWLALLQGKLETTVATEPE